MFPSAALRGRASGVFDFEAAAGAPRSAFLLGVARGRAMGSTVFFLDAGIDLFPVHLDLRRSFDAELHLTRTHFEYGDLHRISDPDVLS
jgi:hypothetical protein